MASTKTKAKKKAEPVEEVQEETPALYDCPVCDNKTLKSLSDFETCSECWWEVVRMQDPAVAGSPNFMSLYEARRLCKDEGPEAVKDRNRFSPR